MTEEPEDDLVDWVKNMSRQTETTTVIVSVTILEDWVEAVIKTKMRELSSNLRARLFTGYGPLSTFSGKIDIGYAFELFDREIYNDLMAIKDIRNDFAHTKKPLHFESPQLAPLYQRLTGWKKDCDCEALFMGRINACVEALKKPLERKALADALRNYRERPPPSQDTNFLERYLHEKTLDEIQASAEDPPRSSQA